MSDSDIRDRVLDLAVPRVGEFFSDVGCTYVIREVTDRVWFMERENGYMFSRTLDDWQKLVREGVMCYSGHNYDSRSVELGDTLNMKEAVLDLAVPRVGELYRDRVSGITYHVIDKQRGGYTLRGDGRGAVSFTAGVAWFAFVAQTRLTFRGIKPVPVVT